VRLPRCASALRQNRKREPNPSRDSVTRKYDHGHDHESDDERPLRFFLMAFREQMAVLRGLVSKYAKT
jgi:hypothetical protein